MVGTFRMVGARNFRRHVRINADEVSRYSVSTRVWVGGAYVAFLALTLSMTFVLNDAGGMYDRLVMALVYFFMSFATLSVLNEGLVAQGDHFVRINWWGQARRFHRSEVKSVSSSSRNGAYRVRLEAGSVAISKRMENAEAVARRLGYKRRGGTTRFNA